MILSVDVKFSNLRNRTIRLNPFQFSLFVGLFFFFFGFCFYFTFISRSLPAVPTAFSKLTVSRAGFFASCDRPDGGGGGFPVNNFKTTNAAATKIIQNNLFIVANFYMGIT